MIDTFNGNYSDKTSFIKKHVKYYTTKSLHYILLTQLISNSFREEHSLSLVYFELLNNAQSISLI